jgi:hypothetical protein
MIFPSLRRPLARARPHRALRQPARLMLTRVCLRRRHDWSISAPEVENLDAYGFRTGRATDPAMEAAT